MSAGTRYAIALALSVSAAGSLLADEIKLKDGKKLYGVIVGYEDNMFRVQTDFGFVLVEKDKIASIVPATGAGKEPAASAAAKAASKAAETTEKAAANTASANKVPADVAGKAKISEEPVRPSLPTSG